MEQAGRQRHTWGGAQAKEMGEELDKMQVEKKKLSDLSADIIKTYEKMTEDLSMFKKAEANLRADLERSQSNLQVGLSLYLSISLTHAHSLTHSLTHSLSHTLEASLSADLLRFPL